MYAIYLIIFNYYDNNKMQNTTSSSIPFNLNLTSTPNKSYEKCLSEVIDNYASIAPKNKQVYSLAIEKNILESNIKSLSAQISSLTQLYKLKSKELDSLIKESESGSGKSQKHFISALGNSNMNSNNNNKIPSYSKPITLSYTKEEFFEEEALDHQLIKKYDEKLMQKKKEMTLNNDITILTQKELFLKEKDDYRNKGLLAQNELCEQLRTLSSQSTRYISKEEHNYMIQKEMKEFLKKRDACTLKYKTINKLYSSYIPMDNRSITVTDKSPYMTSLPNEKCLTLEGMDETSPFGKKQIMMRYPALQKKKIVFADAKKGIQTKHKNFAYGKNIQLEI